MPSNRETSSRLTDSMPMEGDREVAWSGRGRWRFRARDGLEIPSYLYRPGAGWGDEDGRHPAIVWTHGGPTSQWEDSFEPAIQFFVQRGYVVLLPNVRGSSGYGRAFEEANDGCWGKCDFADAVAAAEYLRTLPYVHPERIGTTGTSYGGFMSCAAVSFGGETFGAVIAASGYCDRVTFFEDGEFRHLQQLRKEMGRLAEHRDRYLANSPYYHLSGAQAPVFVLHGEGRYPGSPQMTEFFRELQRLYKPARYKAYPGENFYVRGFDNTDRDAHRHEGVLRLLPAGQGRRPAGRRVPRNSRACRTECWAAERVHQLVWRVTGSPHRKKRS